MAEGSKVTPEDLELAAPSEKYVGHTLKEAREALERNLIKGAMAANNGNLSRTAAELGISRPTLYELIEKLGIERG
jgi:two-component system NtrC family response regulator